MSLLAAHINDVSIAVVGGGRVLYREPGFALLENDTVTTGDAALKRSRLSPRQIQNRFWSELSTEAIADRRFAHLTNADLVSRQLEDAWSRVAGSGDRLVVAVPPYMSTEQLALFLGIAADLSIPVAGLVDAAVAATRREYKNAVPVHVDLSLHCAMLSRLRQPAMAQVERSQLIDTAGIVSLGDAWIRKISDAFVQQSRFDPLHTADTEQLLLDRLPSWLDQACGGDAVALDIEYRGISHHAEIESLALVESAAPVYQRIASQLRALLRAGETPALQLTDRAARMPGLADTLKARVGGEVFMLERGATAHGLEARCADLAAVDGSVNLVRQLAWDQAAAAVDTTPETGDAGRPTHLLLDSVAYALTTDAIVLGSQPTDGARWIDLKTVTPGMSRRHCSLSTRNGQCVVEDHSRYGTFLNGHRIDGSAVLQCGDIVRLGTPGVELKLIRTED